MGRLSGRRVVVTRATHQAEELARPLRQFGAEVILLPVIAIAPPLDPEPLRQAAARLGSYDWVVFTSANAVEALAAQVGKAFDGCTCQIATVGAATREAAEKRGLAVSLTPEKHVAEALVEAFGAKELAGRRILLPSAAVTREVLATELAKRGALVEVVEAYCNTVPPEAGERAATVFRDPYPDWVTFASSSAVQHLIGMIGTRALAQVKIASIGPVTSATVREQGLTVTAEAMPHTVEGLAEAMAR